MKENLAVIFGGVSCEHDISIISAIQAINNIDTNFYNIIPIYITKKGVMLTGKKLMKIDTFANFNVNKFKKVNFVTGSNILHIKRLLGFVKWKKIDVCMVIMHGINGEDGKIMSILELCNIPHTAANVVASSVCLDKCVFKEYVKGLNVSILNSVNIFEFEFKKNPEKTVEKAIKKIGLPIILKPATLGSSIGIKVCNTKEELYEAIKLTLEFCNKVLAEKYVKNLTEVNVAILGINNDLKVSELEQPIKNNDILSFDNKYIGSGSMENLKRIMPAKISSEQKNIIVSMAKDIFMALGLKGVVRFDFIIDNDDKKIYVNEVNTIPGSLAFYLFKPLNLTYANLINKLVSFAYIENENNNSKITSFNSSVLSVVDTNLGLKK